jgi:CHASE2 domain-containing sensor protein
MYLIWAFMINLFGKEISCFLSVRVFATQSQKPKTLKVTSIGTHTFVRDRERVVRGALQAWREREREKKKHGGTGGDTNRLNCA